MFKEGNNAIDTGWMTTEHWNLIKDLSSVSTEKRLSFLHSKWGIAKIRSVIRAQKENSTVY